LLSFGVIHLVLLMSLLCFALSCAQPADRHPADLLGWRCAPQADGSWLLHDAQGQEILRGSEADCLAERYARLRALHGGGLPNLPVATLGGKHYWADLLIRDGWRIQRNINTGHCRLLDPADIRRAWGSYPLCRLAMEQRILAGEIGSYDPAVPTVILVHGIFRSKDSFAGLHRHLRAQGFQVIALNYPSTSHDLTACADDVASVLDNLPAFEHCAVVTHSMGGLVMRVLLDPQRPAAWRQRFSLERLCMLFPPNQGAAKADALHSLWLYEQILGPAGQQLTTAEVARLPVPDLPMAIIAGGTGSDRGRSQLVPGDDDGTVAVAETLLPGAEGPLVLPLGHTFGMNDPLMCRAVEAYLRQGRLPTPGELQAAADPTETPLPPRAE
jgi:pimeloyl-ACP methyl ester carboxylesterase